MLPEILVERLCSVIGMLNVRLVRYISASLNPWMLSMRGTS